MPVELIAALSITAVVIGVCGIVVPVLPGSMAILVGLLVWAIWGGAPTGWLVFAVGGLLVLGGMSAQYLITGRRLKERQIPSRSVVIGLVCGVIGLFVIPFLGLPIGFVAGLLASEYLRVRDLREAWSTSWAALKSVGLGMVVELGLALAAATTLLVGIVTHLIV
ncbi:MAG: DUF456 domain-containing protein [Propionibacteriaceae bacterium]|nr:DUF456 domain-containing protein [Propionibacteriaceae bacterium]